MAARTIYDCDRCGKPGIGKDQIEFMFMDDSGREVFFDLCEHCQAFCLGVVAYEMSENGLVTLENHIKEHRVKAPYDMRP